jgi:hypothetical protein
VWGGGGRGGGGGGGGGVRGRGGGGGGCGVWERERGVEWEREVGVEFGAWREAGFESCGRAQDPCQRWRVAA